MFEFYYLKVSKQTSTIEGIDNGYYRYTSGGADLLRMNNWYRPIQNE